MVEVEASEMPQDIGWELNGDGSISVPVPEGVTIETFVDSLRAFSWVISIGYRRAGSMIGEKYLQTLREGKEWPLVRMGGKVWIEDYVNEGRYWEVDTTRVLVQVYDPSAVPEDITWRFNILNYATVPVPEDMLIEDFMASLRELSWVKLVEYNTYGEYTNEDESVGIGDIHESIPEKVQSSEVDIYDLTGRPLRSRPSKGLYIQKGKKKMIETKISEILKTLAGRDLCAAGVLATARKSGFICPQCGNGSGDDITIKPNISINRNTIYAIQVSAGTAETTGSTLIRF